MKIQKKKEGKIYKTNLAVNLKLGNSKASTQPILAHINYNLKINGKYSPLIISTGVSIHPNFWDTKQKRITGKDSHLNLTLNNIKDAIRYVFEKYRKHGIKQPDKDLFKTEIKTFLENQTQPVKINHNTGLLTELRDEFFKLVKADERFRNENVISIEKVNGGALTQFTLPDENGYKADELIDNTSKAIFKKQTPKIDTEFESNIENYNFKALKHKPKLFITDYIKLKTDYWKATGLRTDIRGYTLLKTKIETFEELHKTKIDLFKITQTDDDGILHKLVNWFCNLKKANGEIVALGYVGSLVKDLKMFIRQATITDKLPVKIETRQEIFKKREEITMSVANTLPQLEKLYATDFGKPHLNKYRDLFIVGSFLGGLRPSDIKRMKEIQSRVNNKGVREYFIWVTTIKNDVTAKLPIHPVVMEISKKYNGNIPPLDEANKNFNNAIQEIGKIAGFTEMLHWSRKHPAGGKHEPIPQSSTFYDLMSGRTMRKNFCTLMLTVYKVPKAIIMTISQHKTEEAFNAYVKHNLEVNYEIMNEVFQNDTAFGLGSAKNKKAKAKKLKRA